MGPGTWIVSLLGFWCLRAAALPCSFRRGCIGSAPFWVISPFPCGRQTANRFSIWGGTRVPRKPCGVSLCFGGGRRLTLLHIYRDTGIQVPFMGDVLGSL